MDKRKFSIGDLSVGADVSARTIRHYITVGLLPGAVGQGRTSHYTDEHLRTLLKIQNLKREGESLGDIRAILSEQDVEIWRNETSSEGHFEHIKVAPDIKIQMRMGMTPQRKARVLQALGTFSRAIQNLDEKMEDPKCPQ